MESRLRVYTIKPGRLDEWVDEWRERIYPLRLERGFQIPAAWVVEGEERFVWLLAYDGPEGWEKADAAYYASAERAAIEPNPARHLAAAEEWVLRPVVSPS